MKCRRIAKLGMIVSCCLFTGCGTSARNDDIEPVSNFDFRSSKVVDEQAGAWKTHDGRCMVFFFTDHTVLQLYFGESTIGTWRYTKSNKPEIKTLEFQEAPDDGIFKAAFRQAWIDGDSLFVDQGDYANELTRMKLHRKPWEKGE